MIFIYTEFFSRNKTHNFLKTVKQNMHFFTSKMFCVFFVQKLFYAILQSVSVMNEVVEVDIEVDGELDLEPIILKYLR